MARASSWRRDHSTRSQPSAPADPTKVIEWRVSAVASRRGKRDVERVTSRIGLFLPPTGYGGNVIAAAGSWKKRERGSAASAPAEVAEARASGLSWRP